VCVCCVSSVPSFQSGPPLTGDFLPPLGARDTLENCVELRIVADEKGLEMAAPCRGLEPRAQEIERALRDLGAAAARQAAPGTPGLDLPIRFFAARLFAGGLGILTGRGHRRIRCWWLVRGGGSGSGAAPITRRLGAVIALGIDVADGNFPVQEIDKRDKFVPLNAAEVEILWRPIRRELGGEKRAKKKKKKKKRKRRALVSPKHIRLKHNKLLNAMGSCRHLRRRGHLRRRAVQRGS
jgi:hypothetical protein